MTDRLRVTLGGQTEADLDVLFQRAADLATGEERSPSSPAPLSRSAFDTRLAQATDAAEEQVRFVVDLDGAVNASTPGSAARTRTS